ncbi:MAG TPA: FUSC family protein [Candidatus Binatia bacterium]|nr:FUSC family protein [Candidatus Binatia bacterium]
MPANPGPIAIIKAGLLRPTVLTALRTTAAAVLSVLLARLLKLPEYYWAPISAIVVIESTIDPKTIAWQRFVGTALGAAIGALIGTYFSAGVLTYAMAVFACGAVCALFQLPGASRFASITVTIILLIAHQAPVWRVAVHRFVEVSLGIAVGLGLALAWRIDSA